MAAFVQVPPAAITRVLSHFDRDQLAGFVAVAIDLMDLADGDPDVELNGDEADGTNAEDEVKAGGDGPVGLAGCPISDPPELDDEDYGGDEGEPDFRRRRRYRRNESGPGCIISDSDFGGEEAGEPEEAL